MRIVKILFCLTFLNEYTSAQVLLGSAGASQSNATTQLQWSMSESVIGSYNGNNHFLSIGFQQPIYFEVVGLEETEMLTGVNIYPNPFLEYLYLELPAKINKDYMLTINSMNGTVIDVAVENEVGRMKIDARKWKYGVYILKIVHKQQIFTAKLIKP